MAYFPSNTVEFLRSVLEIRSISNTVEYYWRRIALRHGMVVCIHFIFFGGLEHERLCLLSSPTSTMPSAWSEREDINLCKAFLNVSEDSSVGTDQSSSKLWQRVFEKFEELRKSDASPLIREKSATLQTRWAGKIKPDVALFANVLHQVKRILDAVYKTNEWLRKSDNNTNRSRLKIRAGHRPRTS